MQIYDQVAHLSCTSQELATAYLIFQHGHPNRERRQNMLLEKLADTLKLAIYGSFTPPVPAPMTQWHFEELIKLEPWVQEMQRLAGSPMPQNLQMVDAGDHLMEDVLTLQEEYLKEALALRPSWPGQRMDLAVQQMGLARKVFKEAVLFSYDLRSNDKQLQAAIGMFRDNHARLKDGGEAIPAIMLPERQDLMDQWELVDAAWNELLLSQNEMTADTVTKTEVLLERLVEQLQLFVPLCGLEDVKYPDQFPYSLLAYGVLGFLFVCCCCVVAFRIFSHKHKRQAQNKKSPASSSAAAAERDDV